MNSMDRVAEHFQSLLGEKKVLYLGELSALTIRRYALAVGETNPLYYDTAFAQNQGYEDIIAPPNLLASIMEWEVGDVETNLSRDGIPQFKGLLPDDCGGIRVMGGGEEKFFYHSVAAGTCITLTSEIIDTYTKQGRKGKIVFLVFKNTYRNEEEQLLCVCNRSMIIR